MQQAMWRPGSYETDRNCCVHDDDGACDGKPLLGEGKKTPNAPPPAYASPPVIGRLGADWSQWFTFTTHNGLTISWR